MVSRTSGPRLTIVAVDLCDWEVCLHFKDESKCEERAMDLVHTSKTNHHHHVSEVVKYSINRITNIWHTWAYIGLLIYKPNHFQRTYTERTWKQPTRENSALMCSFQNSALNIRSRNNLSLPHYELIKCTVQDNEMLPRNQKMNFCSLP